MAIGKTPCPSCGGPMHRGYDRCLSCASGIVSATPPVSTVLDVKGDTAQLTKSTTERVRTLADLIRVCQIDTDEWEVERWIANKWEVGAKSKKEDRIKTTELYQIKAWLKRRVLLIAAKDEIRALVELAKKDIVHPHRRVGTVKLTPDANMMLEIGIFDLHAGKLAWSAETGHGNYDTKIAERLYSDALDQLLFRACMYKYDHILLVTGNDLLNSDNAANTTTRGTAQDADSRFHKTFAVVRTMLIRAIERCRQVAPVVVPIVPGNHDTLAAWHLGDSLESYFHTFPDVTIQNAPTQRKYHQFGSNMLMFTHGDKGKHADYPLVMATEQPTMFGSTTHREAHVGHTHQVRTQERHGVRVRTLSALCPPDAWHAENQYVGNEQAAEAFMWHKTEGLVGTAIYTAPKEKV